MLHGVIVTSTSGIVLFQKEFVTQLPKSKQIGGIITAMLKFSQQKVGLPVSYIELSSIGVSISTNHSSRVTCTIFHDSSDGSEFGRLLSSEFLATFVQTFQTQLNNNHPIQTQQTSFTNTSTITAAASSAASSSNSTHQTTHHQTTNGSTPNGATNASASGGGGGTGIFAMDNFVDFQSKIPDIIRNAVKPLLDQLQEQRGIALVLLSSSSSHDNPHDSAPSSALQYSTQEVDKLAVLANHQALLGVATDIMGAQNDTANSIILRSRRTTLILLRVERASMIVVFKNSVDATVCLKKIEKTADIVRKVLVMASNLKT